MSDECFFDQTLPQCQGDNPGAMGTEGEMSHTEEHMFQIDEYTEEEMEEKYRQAQIMNLMFWFGGAFWSTVDLFVYKW